MGLTDERQMAKNITDYRQNEKKTLPTTDRNINRQPTIDMVQHCKDVFTQKKNCIFNFIKTMREG